MDQIRLTALVIGIFLTAGAAPVAAADAKYDKAACDLVRAEQVKLIEAGVLADISRGPEWVKANAPAARLKEVERFLSVDEQLKFGCREARITLIKPGAAEKPGVSDKPGADGTKPGGAGPSDATGAAVGEPEDDSPSVVRPLGSPKPEGKAKPAPASKSTAPSTSGEAATKPKPKARPKPAGEAAAARSPASDAYSPPAGGGSSLTLPAPAFSP